MKAYFNGISMWQYIAPKRHAFYALTVLFILAASWLPNGLWAQSSPNDCGKLNCTSNDVQIKKAYLTDANKVPLPADFVCGPPVYLTVELSTNTPRVGVTVFANIRTYDPVTKTTGSIITTVSECFSGLTLSSVKTTPARFTNAITWTCGQPIALTDIFLAWGTGGTDFCAGSSLFKCPGTSAKCYWMQPSEYLPIQIPTPTNANTTKCSKDPGGTTADFDLNNADIVNTVLTGTTNSAISGWYETYSGGNFSNQITDNDGNASTFMYTTGTKIIYAKVCTKDKNGNPTTACAAAQLSLTVNQTPSANFAAIPAVCAGVASASLPYSGAVSAAKYSIDLDGNDMDVAKTNMPASPISIPIPAGKQPGTYAGTITLYSGSDCQSSYNISLTINPNPTCAITGDNSVVEATSNTYSVGAAASYSWSVSGNASIPGNKSGQTVDVLAGSAGSGSYTLSVIVTNAYGCSSTCSKIVTLLDKPAGFTITGSEYCSGDQALGTVNLAASENGISYQLFNASNNTTVQSPKAGNGGALQWTLVSAGTYYVVATSADNQTTKNTSPDADVIMNQLPNVTLAAAGPFCSDASPFQLNGLAVGGIYSGTGVNPTTGSFSPATAGVGSFVIRYTYTDGKGCINYAERTIEVRAKPATPTVCITQPSLCGPATGSVIFTSPAAGQGIRFSIDNGTTWRQSNGNFTEVVPGTVTGIKVEVNGCESAPADCSASSCQPPASPSPITKTSNESDPTLATKTSPTKTGVSNSQSTKEVMVKFEEEPEITAYPNPFRETVNFRFVSPVSGNAVLQVLNSAGQVVGTPFRGQVQAHQPIFTTYKSNTSAGLLHYRLVVGDKSLNGKVMKQ